MWRCEELGQVSGVVQGIGWWKGGRVVTTWWGDG